MAGARGIQAGRAYVEVGVRDKLDKGLRAAQAKLRAFAAGVRAIGMRMVAVGAGAVGAFTAAAKVFASTGDKLHKMAARTGFRVEALSELGFAAEQSGTNIDQLGQALFRMRRRIGNAVTESGPAVRALKELGLSAADLTKLSPEQMFKRVVGALERVPDPARRAQMAFELLGDNARQLMPLLDEGVAGIEKLQKQARSLGLTISTKDADAAAKLTDRFGALWGVMKHGVFLIGGAVAPLLSDLAKHFTGAAGAVNKWLGENRVAVTVGLKLGAAVGAIGIALVALGAVAKVSAVGVAGYSVVVRVASKATALWTARVATLRAVLLAVTAHPLVAIVTGVTAAALAVSVMARQTADLRAELDGTATSLHDVAQGFEHMDAAARQAALATTAEQIGILREEIAKLGWELAEIDKRSVAGSGIIRHVTGEESDRAGVVAALEGAREKLDALTGRRAALEAGPAPAAGGAAQKEWARKAHRLQLALIEDEHERQVELLIERYRHEHVEAKKASANWATLRTVHECFLLELDRLEGDRQRKRDAEAQRRQADIDNANATRKERIAELELRTTKEGIELQEALLDLEKQRALARAEAAGESLELTKREFELRRKLQDLGRIKEPSALRTTAAGTFNPLAVRGLTGKQAADRTARATEQTVEQLRRLRDDVKRNPLVYGP